MQSSSHFQPQPLTLSYNSYLQRKKNLIGLKIGKYIILKKLGQGGFGAVFKGMNDQTKQLVAIKVLDLQLVQQQPNAYVKNIKKRLIKTQAEMMTKCNNIHLLKCYDIIQNSSLKLMVIEFCNGGTLDDQIYKNGSIPQQRAIKIMKQILNGLAEMHQNNVIHRDLKAQNILSHQGVYKIADFGFSKQLNSNNIQNELKQTKLGTCGFMAPQIIQGKGYGLQADIWSMGVIFYHMVVGRLPFKGAVHQQVLNQIKKQRIFETASFKNAKNIISEDVKQFISQCLIIDSQKRLNWQTITKHKIFKRVQSSIDTAVIMDVQLNVNQMNKLDNFKKFEDNNSIQNIGKEQMPLMNRTEPIITVMNAEELNKKQGQVVSTQKTCAYGWSRAAHFECLKTELILKQIIQPLELCSKNFLQLRDTIQVLYLLSARCFFNMSFKNSEIKYQKQPIVVQLLRLIENLYKKVQSKFQGYSLQLTKKQDEIVQIVKDKLFSLIRSDSTKQRDMFFTGLESQQQANKGDSHSYTKAQQIFYTQKRLNQISQLIQKQNSLSVKTLTYIKFYESICRLTLADVKDQYFITYVAKHYLRQE